MAELTDYSDIQSKAISEIVENDNGFHTEFYIAESPFVSSLSETDDGTTFVQPNFEADIVLSSLTYTVQFEKSNEQKCWFFTVINDEEKIQGIIHFNTIYNSKGLFSFAFLNDSQIDDFDGITMGIPYCNFFLMRK